MNVVSRGWADALPRVPDRLPLTERQRSIFDFIQLYIGNHGFPPTHQEIAAAFEFASCNAAHCHLQALVKKGWIRIRKSEVGNRRLSRGIQVL